MAIEILVVDDSAVMRKMIIKTINLCGLDIANIFEADNGKEGLKVLQNEKVDLLFADINMPVMDGVEMLNEVRQQEGINDLPVLIISTESNKERIEDIVRQGAGFVHKPFTPEKLRDKMLGVIEGIED